MTARQLFCRRLQNEEHTGKAGLNQLMSKYIGLRKVQTRLADFWLSHYESQQSSCHAGTICFLFSGPALASPAGFYKLFASWHQGGGLFFNCFLHSMCFWNSAHSSHQLPPIPPSSLHFQWTKKLWETHWKALGQVLAIWPTSQAVYKIKWRKEPCILIREKAEQKCKRRWIGNKEE